MTVIDYYSARVGYVLVPVQKNDINIYTFINGYYFLLPFTCTLKWEITRTGYRKKGRYLVQKINV